MRPAIPALLTVFAAIAGLATIGVASAERDRGRDDRDHPRGRPAQILWQPSAVRLELKPGESRTLTVAFTPNRRIEHATLVVRPPRAPLELTPSDLGEVRAGQTQTVTVTAQLADDERRPHRRAQLFVQDGTRRLGRPLHVDIRNAEAEHDEEDDGEENDEDDEDDEDDAGDPAHLRWSPPVVLAMVQPGSTFTATVAFVSDRPLHQARVRVHAKDELSVAASPSDLGDVVASQAMTLTLTVQLPANPARPFFVASVAIVDGEAKKQLRPALWLLLGVARQAPAAPDRTAPTVTASPIPPANAHGWNNTDVQVALAASDNSGGSGVAEMRYRLNGGADVLTAGAVATVTVATEGTTTIAFRAVDQAGNVSAEGRHVVRIDRTPPTITASQASDNRVTLTAGDGEGGSGVAEIRFRLSGGNEIVVSGATATIAVNAAGTTAITFRALDRAGNASAEGSVVVHVAVAPTAASLTAAALRADALILQKPEPAERVQPAQPALPAQPAKAAGILARRAAAGPGNLGGEVLSVAHGSGRLDDGGSVHSSDRPRGPSAAATAGADLALLLP